MTWHTVDYDFISDFKRSWPAHGLPDELDTLRAETDSRGDLVDIEALGENADGEPIVFDTHEFDGSALAALVQDCIEKGATDEAAAFGTPKP